MGKIYPIVSDEYKAAVKKARRKLRGLISEKHCAPIIVRLGWHGAGTYDVETNTGGPFGTIKCPEELAHGANAELEIDFWSLSRNSFLFCHMQTSISSLELLLLKLLAVLRFLPDATKGPDHLRDVFGRMGLTDKEIVALSGAHTLGRCHIERSGFEGA